MRSSTLVLLLTSAATSVKALPADLLDALEITSRAMAPRRLQDQNQTTGNETDNSTAGGNETNQTAGGAGGASNETNQTAGGNVTTGNATGIAGFNATGFAAAFMVNNVTDPGCTGECCQCVANATEMMLVNASQVLNASCAEGSNRGTTAVCDFLRTQQNITVGMVLGFGNINELATAYCVGNSSCPAPVVSANDACPQRSQMLANASDVTSAGAVFSTGMALQRGVGSSYLTCLLNTAFTIMDRRVALNSNYCRSIMEQSGGSNQTSNSTNTTGMRSIKSLRNTFQDQTNNATDGGQTNGTTSQQGGVCTYDQRVCEYEQQNPDIAWGLLYADLQPLKYARGFCAGLLMEP